MRRIGVLSLLLLALAVGRAAAQIVDTTGVRALGMAGAFVAVADDASATYWNPAGLAGGDLFGLALERHALEAIDDATAATDRSATGFALATPALGLSYYRLRWTDGVAATAGSASLDRQDARPDEIRSLITHQAGVTLVQSLAPGLTAGATIKFVRGIAILQSSAAGHDVERLLDEASDLIGRAGARWDIDVGALAVLGPVRAGLVARQIRRPSFRTPNGEAIRVSRQVRAGVALRPDERLTLAVDVDLTRTESALGDRRIVALGVERWLGTRLGIRGGIRVSALADARPATAAGVSYAIRHGLWLEGQVTIGKRDSDRGWGVGTQVRF